MEDQSITDNSFFNRALRLAAKIVKNTAKAMLYITGAGRKLLFIKGTGEEILKLRSQLTDLIDMLTAYYKGEYKRVPYKTLVKALGAVIYFVSIIDLIPDFIPFFGLLDDVAVVAWVVTGISKDISHFKLWRDGAPEHVEEIDSSEKDKKETVG